MRKQAIDTLKLKKLIAAMGKDGEVFGPVAGEAGEAVLGPLTDKTPAVLNFGNFKLPLKRVFFPQCEVLSTAFAGTVTEEKPEHKKIVLFGIRTCDAKAMEHLDRVFLGQDAIDPYYSRRREDTLVISMACTAPASSACFCLSTGAGPSNRAGADAVAFNLGKAVVFESVTERGDAFLTKHKTLFRQPTAAELEGVKRQEAATHKKLSQQSLSDAPKLLKKQPDPGLWAEVSATCLSCGACTYLCPTCHCFDFQEESVGDGSRKLRVHDACMFESFTREASGHNPRADKSKRMQQRVMHKFSYAPENYNELFCVGCGRCIINCPSAIDIRETVAKVTL